MKVLKNNYDAVETSNKEIKNYPREFVCEKCDSVLEYEKSDLKMGTLGCMQLSCPCCGHSNMVEEDEGTITLTANNVVFPTHFFHTSKEGGAVDVCNNDEIRERIQDAIAYFRKYKKEIVWTTQYGNLFLSVFRNYNDRDYSVFVTNNYYETYISFEPQDY